MRAHTHSRRYEYGQASRDTLRNIAATELGGAHPIHFVHHFGDISYAVGFLQTWDEFLYMMTAVTSRVLYLIGARPFAFAFCGWISWGVL